MFVYPKVFADIFLAGYWKIIAIKDQTDAFHYLISTCSLAQPAYQSFVSAWRRGQPFRSGPLESQSNTFWGASLAREGDRVCLDWVYSDLRVSQANRHMDDGKLWWGQKRDLDRSTVVGIVQSYGCIRKTCSVTSTVIWKRCIPRCSSTTMAHHWRAIFHEHRHWETGGCTFV